MDYNGRAAQKKVDCERQEEQGGSMSSGLHSQPRECPLIGLFDTKQKAASGGIQYKCFIIGTSV